MRKTVLVILVVAIAAVATWVVARSSSDAALPSGVVSRWETWTSKDGLPGDRVFAVLVAPEGVYAGTEKGLALVKDGRVARTWTEADGLSFRVVSALARDPRDGTVWVGTMRGVTKIASGKATAIRQSADGLANDVVYSLCVEGKHLWCATAAGLSRCDLDTSTWNTWTEKNSPMKEIWCYSVCSGEGKVWTGIWGSGALERDLATETWRLHGDPDKDMRFDLYRNDGLISDVVVGVSYAKGVLWAASYLGLSRYDGRDWTTWNEDDGGIASSFLNAVKARGIEAWSCTDKGLSQFDGTRWVTYRRGEKGGTVLVTPASGGKATAHETETALPHEFVWQVDFDGRDVWVGTSHGLARGTRNGPEPAATGEGGRP